MRQNHFFRIVLVSITFSVGINVQSQTKTQKQIEFEKNKVELFSVEERDNVQHWVQEEIASMELSEEQSNDYSIILLYYLSKIRRLDDKDIYTSKEELLQKMDNLITKQNKEVREILDKDQFKKHLEFYDKMTLMRKNRIEEMIQ